jgi:diadenosine tetraphosphate (Ap4A) HIT family hydrolase
MSDKKLFPEETVIITDYFDVHQDWGVPIPGFFIIASKRKISSVADFNDDEPQEFMKLVCTLRKGMRDILNIKNIYLFQNEDTEYNFHLWIFPRFEWMEKFGRKIESIRPIINYAKENMVKDEVLGEVRSRVKQMKEYMKDF